MRTTMRIVSAVLALLCIVLLVSCKDEDSGVRSGPVSIGEVKTAVFKSDFPEMVELGNSQLSNYYTLETEWVTEFSVYVADSENVCDEVAIFRLADADYTMNVVSAIENRVNSQISMLNNQNKAEFNKLSARVLLQKEDIIVLVISPLGNEIAERLENDYGFEEIVVQ